MTTDQKLDKMMQELLGLRDEVVTLRQAEVMKITGHTEIRTFLKYLNPTQQTIQNTAKIMSDFLDANMKG